MSPEQCYPLSVEDERELPDGYDGPAFIWDIDKTYLSTHFSSMKGLTRIPLEFAVDKTAIPGMPEVLRGLRRGPGSGFAAAPLYFVSASPPQMRRVLEHKMLMDGVEYDGITSKDWLLTIRQRRPGRMREQVGFKLCALIEGRQRRPMAVEYLFGDDVEQDAAAFYLYARLLAGDLSAGGADEAMAREGVKPDDRRCVFALLDRLPEKRGVVARAFIHLEKGTPPGEFDQFGGLVTPVNGACQLSLALYDIGHIDADTVHQAFDEVASRTGLSDAQRERLTADAVARGLIAEEKLRLLEPAGPL